VDWREVLLGVLVGVATALLGGVVIAGVLQIPLGNLTQAVVAYLPAGFWTAYRARRGHPILNALCAGAILFLISSFLFAVLGGGPIPSEELLIMEVLIIAVVVALGAVIAQLFRRRTS